MEFSGLFPLHISPARIEWRGKDADEPWACDFEDIYFAPGQGEAESWSVFIEGNHLVQRSRQNGNFYICETGFGTGLNFLLTADLFARESAAFLHYVSFEKHPLLLPDLERALKRYAPSSAKAALLAHYPPLVPGFHTIEISERVLLTLVFGDALEMIPLLRGKFDAFFLDGFAPSRNPDLWSEELILELGKRAKPGASLSTFSAAGNVRRALMQAGFLVTKVPGFGGKRERTQAVYPTDSLPAEQSAHPEKPVRQRSAAVIGAGIAGAACARALARRGIRVTVFEKNAPASGASGNRYGVFQPVLAAQRTHWSRWTLEGFWYLQSLGLLSTVPHGRGLFQAASDPDEERRLTSALTLAGTDELISAEEAFTRTGIKSPCGVYSERAGYLSPPVLVEALLRASGCEMIKERVTRIESASVEAPGDAREEHTPEVLVHTEARVRSFDAVVLCPGSELPELLADGIASDASFEIVRGQVNYLPAGSTNVKGVYLHDGYIIAGPDCTVIGGTYDRSTRAAETTLKDQKIILDLLERAVPGASAPFAGQILPGTAGLRIAGTDHLPLFGRMPGLNGIYVSSGHGSRGMISAPLAAEIIAAEISGGVVPVESDLVDFFSARFTERKARRAAKGRPPGRARDADPSSP
jgi:tRNA 5-methylaminomethyl-2-thiouridine biosynthesis bifunctional protein